MRRLLPLLLAIPLLSCTAFYGSPDANQCTSDADCETEPALQGRICRQNVCVEKNQVVESPDATGCESTDLCTTKNSNRPSVCRKVGEPCLDLQTTFCDSVVGEWQNPNALFIGTVAPTCTLAPGNCAEIPYVKRLRKTINLGLDEWNESVKPGLPNSNRPLAIVHCNSQHNEERAGLAMNHLVNTVRAPVVLAGGDLDVEYIVEKAVASNTAIVCADCTAKPTNAANEAGLVWRVLPELAEQAPLVAWRVRDLETRIRAERSLPESVPIKVALFSQWDPGINDYADAIREALYFNGKNAAANGANFEELRTPDPRPGTPIDYDGFVNRLVDFSPDVILVGIDSDFASYYFPFLENCGMSGPVNCWPEGKPRPYYVMTVLNQELGLLEPMVAENDDLRRRISGAGPFMDAGLERNLQDFTAGYRRANLGEDPDNTQTGYDAFYSTAYALLVADITQKFEGLEISRGFERQIGGLKIDVGKNAIPTALLTLQTNTSPIDLAGASSALDWDTFSHRVSDDVGLWCLTRSQDGALELTNNAGPRWDHATGAISGAYECP